MRGHACTALAIVGIGSLAGMAAGAADPALPAHLASYRSWTTLTAKPQPIPFQLAQMCAPAMAGAQPATALANAGGPHGGRWTMVYANPAAASALGRDAIARFPAGAILVKEKRLTADATHPEGIGFMIKHKAGEFDASGGWEFGYVPSAGASADMSGCIDCHRTKGKKDYVFASHGANGGR